MVVDLFVKELVQGSTTVPIFAVKQRCCVLFRMVWVPV